MGAEAFSAQSEHPWGMSDIWAPLRRSRLTTGLRIHISHPRNAFIKQPDPGTSPFSLYKGTCTGKRVLITLRTPTVCLQASGKALERMAAAASASSDDLEASESDFEPDEETQAQTEVASSHLSYCPTSDCVTWPQHA